MFTTDNTKTAAEIEVGMRLHDSQSYNHIIVEWVRHGASMTAIAGYHPNTMHPVTRRFISSAPVVVGYSLDTEAVAL